MTQRSFPAPGVPNTPRSRGRRSVSAPGTSAATRVPGWCPSRTPPGAPPDPTARPHHHQPQGARGGSPTRVLARSSGGRRQQTHPLHVLWPKELSARGSQTWGRSFNPARCRRVSSGTAQSFTAANPPGGSSGLRLCPPCPDLSPLGELLARSLLPGFSPFDAAEKLPWWLFAFGESSPRARRAAACFTGTL